MMNILKSISRRARMHYCAAMLAAFATSLIILVDTRWAEIASPSALALVAVCGLMMTLGSATQCIRIILLDQKEKDPDSALKQ